VYSWLRRISTVSTVVLTRFLVGVTSAPSLAIASHTHQKTILDAGPAYVSYSDLKLYIRRERGHTV